MKKILVILLTAKLLTGVNYAHAADEQCGVISTRAFFLKLDEHPIRLVKHNGKHLHFPFKNKPVSLSLAPGQHDFMTEDGTYFNIDIEPNKRYTLAKTRTRPRTAEQSRMFNTVVKSTKDIECKSSSIYPAKIHTQKLPIELKFKIDDLTNDLQKHYSKYNKKISITLPQRINQNWGIVVDNEFSSTNGISVLSVSPNTISADIGLKAKDVIIGFNNSSLMTKDSENSAITLLRQQLKNLSYGDKITLKIKRQKNLMTLDNNDSVIYLPKITIEIN